MGAEESFPRRQARTQRFTLGEPRNIVVSDDGSRVAFVRSGGPTDPVNSLWVLDVASGVEREVANPAHLSSAGDDLERHLPAAERARRERVRETGAGIVGYDADQSLTTAVFALGGELWRADLASDASPPRRLAAAEGAFDPRLAPDSTRVAYVAGSALRVTSADGSADDRLVMEEPSPTVSWGSAEFVASEEMGRTRAHWWSPDSQRLLAARVDTAPVRRWWISDPGDPGAAPSEIRYPAAGTDNAMVGLAVFDVSAQAAAGSTRAVTKVDVDWNEGGWEYLAGVRWSAEGLLVTVQTRDQRTLGVLSADPESGRCRLLHTVRDHAWVELVPGVPRLVGSRLVTVEDRDTTRTLCVDGQALTPEHMQIRAVHHADESALLVTASTDPTEVHVAQVRWDGEVEWLTEEPGVHSAAVGGNTTVLVSRSMQTSGRKCTVLRDDGGAQTPPQEIASLAAAPGLELNVEITELGPRSLAAALVMPSGAAADSDTALPVLLDPYGGPHAQRVMAAEAQFHTSQWFAAHGFAVLVVDGRGTPGRGPRFERAVHGDLAAPVLEDQIEALEAAARLNPRLDLTRVAIRGWSFGGYLAALAVLKRPDVFAAAVAGAPVTDWRLYDTHYTERYLGHPDTDPDNYARTDLTPLAPGLKRPLMLIHGLADDNVVAAHTVRLSQALTEAGRPHTVLPLSGVTHMAARPEVAENLLLLQLRFLQQALALPSS